MYCSNDSARNQFLFIISANLLIVAFGASCGWPSSSFLILESVETPLQSGPLTTEELSWIVSIFCFGGVAGNCLFGWLINKLSRKQILYALAVPQLFSWILIIFAQNACYLYVSRLLVGISGGGGYVVIPIIVAEVSENRVRGVLGSILSLSANGGIVLAFIIGHFFAYETVPQILLALPILFIISITSFPDTPYYLMSVNRTEEAERSLEFFRNIRRKSQLTESFNAELSLIKEKFMQKDEKVEEVMVMWRDFTFKAPRKAFLISFTLILINECCGSFILVSYTATIFAVSGSALSPNLSAVIVGLIQFVGTYISTMFIDRTGRKFLLIVSCLGTGIGNVVLGTYMYLNAVWGYDLSSLSWIPILSFSIIVLLAAIGIIPITYVIIFELMPEKIRGIGVAICMSVSWIIAFIVLKYFAPMSIMFGMHGCILFFALSSFLGTLFVIYVMPETMGRSLDEIQKKLGS